MNKILDIDYGKVFRLDNKIVVVTGALGILGQHYCKALCDMGANVVISDLNQDDCTKFAADLSARTNTECLGLAVNLASESSIVSWSKCILEHYGCVDVLINNAAAKADGFFKPLEEYSLDTWHEVMSVNTDAIFMAVRELGAAMAEKGAGNIINIASIYGVVGPDQRIYDGSWYEDLGGAINTPMVYAASKGAVISMTKYLATYWAAKGIRVNALTPGGVASGQNEVFSKKYSERVPMGRMAQANEIVSTLLFLASDASSYVNGQNIIVDGGWTAW